MRLIFFEDLQKFRNSKNKLCNHLLKNNNYIYKYFLLLF